MNYLEILISNRFINASLMAWITAQLLKVLLIMLVKRRVDFTRFVGAGGMPSSHSATVMALAASICKVYGFSSPYFALAIIFAGVVMYDAAGVRRAAGEQAKILNHIIENWQKQTPDMFEKNLNELLGHTPLQVIAGAVYGTVIGLLM